MTEVRLEPQPLQLRALGQTATIQIIGGAVGAGKSWLTAYSCALGHKIPTWNAIIFRRESPRLWGGGSIGSETEKMYPQLGGSLNRGKGIWSFPSKATVQLTHLQYDASADAHRSKAYTLAAFEEGNEMSSYQFWTIFGRLRTDDPHLKPYFVITCNPDVDSYVYELIKPWLDEEGYPLPDAADIMLYISRDPDTDEIIHHREEVPGSISISFTPGTLDDNKYIGEDYARGLELLPADEKKKLKGGCWLDSSGIATFEKFQVKLIAKDDPALPRLANQRQVRFWDFGSREKEPGTNPDLTASGCLSVMEPATPNELVFIFDGTGLQGKPDAVEAHIVQTAQIDGPGIPQFMEQETGAMPVNLIDYYDRVLLPGHHVEGKKSKGTKTYRAKPLAGLGAAGRVYFVVDDVNVRPEWVARILKSMRSFPKGKRDPIDALSGAHIVSHEHQWSSKPKRIAMPPTMASKLKGTF